MWLSVYEMLLLCRPGKGIISVTRDKLDYEQSDQTVTGSGNGTVKDVLIGPEA